MEQAQIMAAPKEAASPNRCIGAAGMRTLSIQTKKSAATVPSPFWKEKLLGFFILTSKHVQHPGVLGKKLQLVFPTQKNTQG